MALNAADYIPVLRQGGRSGHYSPGGVVTQATNRTTGVTINTLSGQITTNTTSLAAQAAATFTVTNNNVSTSDIVLVSIQSGTNSGNTDAYISSISNGSFTITVVNQTAATPETGAIVLTYLVLAASSTA